MELEYKSQQGQTLFDVSNITLFGMDGIVLGLLSPSNKSLNDSIAIDSLVYDTDYISNEVIQLTLNKQVQSPVYEVIGLENQSTFDLCLMNYGNLDFLVSKMISENSNLVSINDVDVSFKKINFNSNNLVQNYTVSTIKNKGYVFGTIEKTSSNLVWDGLDIIWDGIDYLEY